MRDNPERVEFIGYDTQWARYLTLILSGFFAGISGGLSAINFEIVTAENVSAVRSGGVLLFTFIGGVGFFFGPMIGAIIGPNGAGKSTLFNLISGRFPVSSGNILLNGASVLGLKPFEINRRGLSRSF